MATAAPSMTFHVKATTTVAQADQTLLQGCEGLARETRPYSRGARVWRARPSHPWSRVWSACATVVVNYDIIKYIILATVHLDLQPFL